MNKHASHTLGVKTAIVSSRREKYFSEACATLGLLSTNLRMDGVDVVLGRQLLCVSAQINLYIECNLMHPDETELKNLLIDGLQGNSGAYRLYLIKLSSLLRPYVKRRLVSIGGSSDDFEDIVQEALIAIHAKRHTYEPDLPVTAWAYAITRYKLIDHLRASSRRISTEPLWEADGLIDDREQIEATLDVRKGIAALPSSLRKPLQLVKLDGFNAQDVAEQSGSSPVTVRVNVHRALKALARLLGQAKDDTDGNK